MTRSTSTRSRHHLKNSCFMKPPKLPDRSIDLGKTDRENQFRNSMVRRRSAWCCPGSCGLVNKPASQWLHHSQLVVRRRGSWSGVAVGCVPYKSDGTAAELDGSPPPSCTRQTLVPRDILRRIFRDRVSFRSDSREQPIAAAEYV